MVDCASTCATTLADVEMFYAGLADVVREAAAVRALNRAAVTVRAEAAREIRKAYNLKISDIKDQLTIVRATPGNLRAKVVASGRPLSLSGFAPRQTPQGVTVQVKRGQRKLIRHAFLLARPGGSAVFVRDGRRRLPIKKLYTLSLPSAFTADKVMAVLQKVAETRIAEVYAQELNRAINLPKTNPRLYRSIIAN
jgi:hypothetical protein